jgi:hypothetical protein
LKENKKRHALPLPSASFVFDNPSPPWSEARTCLLCLPFSQDEVNTKGHEIACTQADTVECLACIDGEEVSDVMGIACAVDFWAKTRMADPPYVGVLLLLSTPVHPEESRADGDMTAGGLTSFSLFRV